MSTKRKKQRVAAQIFLFFVGGFLILMGYKGWRISGIPLEYAGYIILAYGCLGLFGVNIWYGGPLDPRNDEKESD